MESAFFTMEELCYTLSVKESWVRSQIFHGRIPYKKVGRLIRFYKPEIEQWLEESKRNDIPVKEAAREKSKKKFTRFLEGKQIKYLYPNLSEDEADVMQKERVNMFKMDLFLWREKLSLMLDDMQKREGPFLDDTLLVQNMVEEMSVVLDKT
jgi:excisionase family DNA binding protein